MIYVCLATRNHSRSVGLLLWKLRKVFHELPREYQVLAADYGSSDETVATLESYQGAVPLSIEQPGASSYAATVEALLRTAVARTDRPKRDLAVTLPADYRTSPAAIMALVRAFESGADVIVGETEGRKRSWGHRVVRQSARYLLSPGIGVRGLRDLTSGLNGYRLVTIRQCLKDMDGPLLHTDGLCADAELVARAAAVARQVAAVSLAEHEYGDAAPPLESPLALALQLFRAGRRLRIPHTTVELKRA